MKSLSKFILSIIFPCLCLGAQAQEVVFDTLPTDSTELLLLLHKYIYETDDDEEPTDSVDIIAEPEEAAPEAEVPSTAADEFVPAVVPAEELVPAIEPAAAEMPAPKAEIAVAEEYATTVDSTSVNWRRSQRGLIDVKNMFIPRGQWIFGGTASYSTQTNDSYTFLVFEDIGSDGYTFKISPLVAYAVKDNMAFGARVSYSRSLTKVDSGEINLGDEESGTHIKADYYYSLKHSYSISAIWRQYIPLGNNKRFAIFNETSITAGAHQKKFAANDPVRGTYETGYSISLDISPGLIAFITNTTAVEVNVGVMGLSYSSTQQSHNRVYTGRVTSSGLNFNINLLAIGLGMSFYL